MSGKVRTIVNLGIGSIVILVTLVVFFLGYTDTLKETIDWLGLIFVLISEIAFFSGNTIFLLKKYTSSQMLLISGIISALLICCIATIVLSVFSRSIFQHNTSGFVTTQIFILAVALSISIALYAAVINVKEHDTKLMNSRLIMNECEKLAFSLKFNSDFSEYSSLLNKIYEEIKYSDKTKSIKKEQNIYNKIEELKNFLSNNENNQKTEYITKMVDEIILLIKERNLSVIKMNKGGF